MTRDPLVFARVVIGGCYLGLGLLGYLISLPLIRGQVPMNHLYGVRTRKSFSSPENWDAINRYGGRQLAGYALGNALVGLVALFVPVAPDRWYFWAILSAPAWLMVPMLWRIFAFAKRLP